MSGPGPTVTLTRGGAVVVVVAIEGAIALASTAGAAPAALIAVAAIGVALAVTNPTMLAVLCLPATFVTLRLSAGSVDLSYADAGLLTSLLACGLFAPWRDRAFRRLVSVAGIYFGLLALAAALQPSMRALIEWGHRVALVLGSAAVGAAIARHGRAHQALRAFVLAGIVVAVEAVRATLADNLRPAYPFTFNKNAAGMLLASALVVVLTSSPTLRWPKGLTHALALPLLAGALACQSRMALAALVVVLLLNGIHRRRSAGLLSLLGIGASVAMVWATRRTFTERGEGSQFNSLNTRLATYERALELSSHHRIAGLGLRYWQDRSLAVGEPHNLVIAALGETGVIGVAALVVLNVLVIAVLRTRRTSLSRLAIYMLLVQLIDGLGDIYWRAGTGTLPWLVVGLALGAAPAARPGSEAADAPLLPLTVDTRRAAVVG